MRDRLVLCYHAVSEDWPNPYSIRPAQFEAQLTMLLRRGYEGATFSRLVAGECPPKALAVTFDDAHRSVRELAFPLLSRLGLPATLFVPTGAVGSGRPLVFEGYEQWLGTPWEHELDAMSWDDVRALAVSGWEIGSHTASHPRLPELGDAARAAELRGSREEIERRLERPCTSLAYPYGAFDEHVLAAAGDAGYSAAAALGHTREAPLSWPRHQVLREESPAYFGRQVSPLVRRARHTVLWPALSGAARAARGLLRRP